MLTAGFKNIKVIKRELSQKMIAPFRDTKTGKFTGLNNPNKHRIYDYEYIIVMRKPGHVR